MTHTDTTPGGWRANTLMDAVAGILPIDRALHLVGVRGTGDLTNRARQDLGDAITAYQAGDQVNAMATACNLAEEIQALRTTRGAAA
jgi:hypothetical protein